MADDSAQAPMISSAQRLAANVIGLLYNHLSIFSMELEEERDRLVYAMALAVAAAGVFVVGIGLISIAMVWWIGPVWRGWALFAVGLFDLLLAGGCLVYMKRMFGKVASPFSITRAQLRKDRAHFLP